MVKSLVNQIKQSSIQIYIFRARIIEDVEDTIQITEDEDIKLAWKWERRLIQQTTVKKQPLPWNKLLRERNWDAVTQHITGSKFKKEWYS